MPIRRRTRDHPRRATSRRDPRARFDRLVEEALAGIPDRFQPYLAQVAILVEDWPDPAELDAMGIPPDETVYGLQRGPSVAERDASPVPPVIVIYRGPLLEDFATDAAIRREARITVLHEIGHYLGFDEDDLARLGLA